MAYRASSDTIGAVALNLSMAACAPLAPKVEPDGIFAIISVEPSGYVRMSCEGLVAANGAVGIFLQTKVTRESYDLDFAVAKELTESSIAPLT